MTNPTDTKALEEMRRITIDFDTGQMNLAHLQIRLQHWHEAEKAKAVREALEAFGKRVRDDLSDNKVIQSNRAGYKNVVGGYSLAQNIVAETISQIAKLSQEDSLNCDCHDEHGICDGWNPNCPIHGGKNGNN